MIQVEGAGTTYWVLKAMTEIASGITMEIWVQPGLYASGVQGKEVRVPPPTPDNV